jgi:type IV pilus assembly protein PilV
MGVAMFNKKGVTLIEMMIALVILLVVSLALMQTAIIGMNVNLQNILRDEAVNIAEMRMNQLRSLPYDSITGRRGTGHADVSWFTETYTPTRTVSTYPYEYNIKQVTISLSWDYRERPITTALRRS